MSFTIIIPIVLLIIGTMSFWILVESSLSYILKILMISLFCIFVSGFLFSIHSYLGWSALERELPEKVTISWVVIKEPNVSLGVKGRIYFLLDSVKSKYDKKFMEMFNFKNEKEEPRLFSVPYSRELHEQLSKDVIPKLKQGQSVTGRLKKGKGKGKDGKSSGDKDGNLKESGDGKGYGGSSQEQDYMFYTLPPSEIITKNDHE